MTALQSRWTNNLGQATTRQQTAQVQHGAELLGRAFDTQVNEACAQLRPRGEQIESLGHEEAHAQCLSRWEADKPRPLFRRLGVMVPTAGQAQLFMLDQKSARLTQAEWPPEWAALQQNLSARAAGRLLQPFVDPAGLLREYPVFGQHGAGRPGRPGEVEWVILELDPVYVAQVWLPELVRAFLNPSQEAASDVLVQSASSSSNVVFSTGPRELPVKGGFVTVDFNSKARGGHEDADDPRDYCWTLYAWPRSGELAVAVSSARSHDLALACVLDACLLIGGLLIIHYARRARRLGDARMRFVAAVSHELRTPLTVIRAAGQNLRRGIARDPAHLDKYAGMIIEHADRLAEMVEQVLAFAGAKRNEANLVRKPVQVTQIVQEAIAACSLDTQAAGCEVQTTIEGEPPGVLGDSNALCRVFQNLLTNAAKHGGRGQWIGVRTRYVGGSSPGCVEVEVSDRGEGIPLSEQPHIFEPFFRGERAHGRQTRGSGIGLSVVEEIVKVHHGNVRVQSSASQGTTFTISLPALPADKLIG